MKIPKDFKNIMQNVMYDKELKIYEVIEEVNEELEVERKKGNFILKINGNVQPASHDIALRDYGLNIEANFICTCDPQIKIPKNTLIEYIEYKLEITGILIYDTHQKIFLKEV